jgi:hypothetical protein
MYSEPKEISEIEGIGPEAAATIQESLDIMVERKPLPDEGDESDQEEAAPETGEETEPEQPEENQGEEE